MTIQAIYSTVVVFQGWRFSESLWTIDRPLVYTMECCAQPSRRLTIHRCATGDTSASISLWNGFCGFISDQDKNITSFVAWNKQDNFFLYISVNQGNLAKSFLKIAVYLTFPYLIPYKIPHVYLPEMSVRKTYPSHPRKTRNTPSCTSMYP